MAMTVPISVFMIQMGVFSFCRSSFLHRVSSIPDRFCRLIRKALELAVALMAP